MALLSGGNPKIAKGDGDAPVQAYRGGSDSSLTGLIFEQRKLGSAAIMPA
jgi:hypothetical protein